MIVYLSGGMRGDWQDRVIDAASEAATNIRFIDPRRNDSKSFAEYTALDLHHVRRCDVVLAFLELDNPGGAGLFCEVAYAKGLGKTVILVNERNDRYEKFVESLADIVCEDLDAAIKFLLKLQA